MPCNYIWYWLYTWTSMFSYWLNQRWLSLLLVTDEKNIQIKIYSSLVGLANCKGIHGPCCSNIQCQLVCWKCDRASESINMSYKSMSRSCVRCMEKVVKRDARRRAETEQKNLVENFFQIWILVKNQLIFFFFKPRLLSKYW